MVVNSIDTVIGMTTKRDCVTDISHCEKVIFLREFRILVQDFDHFLVIVIIVDRVFF